MPSTDSSSSGQGVPVHWDSGLAEPADRSILLSRFGMGHVFIDTVSDWWHAHGHLTANTGRLTFAAIDSQLVDQDELAQYWQSARSSWPTRAFMDACVAELITQWPCATRNVHLLTFVQGRVRLQLHVKPSVQPPSFKLVEALKDVTGQFDALDLRPLRLQEDPHLQKAVARLAWPHANLIDAAGTRRVHDPRQQAAARKHHGLDRLGPALAHKSLQHVAIVGAGIAGAHVAAALAVRGMRCTVIECQTHPATQGSGGQGGIVHGTVHRDDSTHARLLRGAALHAAAHYRGQRREACDSAPPLAMGVMAGLLRLADAHDSARELQSIIDAQRLPPDWVTALDASQASQVAGVELHRAAWWFAKGGWVNPSMLCEHLLNHERIHLQTSRRVDALQRKSSTQVGMAEGGPAWQLIDERGDVVTQADAVVLTNAFDAARLVPWAEWPLFTTRGQTTTVQHLTFDGPRPKVPMSGDGYAIPLPDGSVLCGASSHANDHDAEAQAAHTRHNLERLHRLTGMPIDKGGSTQDRVAWRATTPDRLPIVGAVPARETGSGLNTQGTTNVRHVPRERGLYTLTGLGSRGLTLAPLLAEVVVASMLREPVPIESDLLDSIDAARYLVAAKRLFPKS
jgi:tRNA 5-methylaminomethyl-2-thiouridine biosynthesis bifunctional protein